MTKELGLSLLGALAVVLGIGVFLNWAMPRVVAEKPSTLEEFTFGIEQRIPLNVLTTRAFQLSAMNRMNLEEGVALLNVTQDGTTLIRGMKTNREYSAKPGGHFSGGEFGEVGLELKAANAGTQTADFVRRECVAVLRD